MFLKCSISFCNKEKNSLMMQEKTYINLNTDLPQVSFHTRVLLLSCPVLSGVAWGPG